MDKWLVTRVDLKTREIRSHPVPGPWQHLGGRALSSTIVAETVPPQSDPLGPRNALVITSGLLAGSGASSSTRVSVGAKSPLTGGIKESNVGGQAGYALASLGVRSLIFEGEAAPAWTVAHLGPNGLHLEPTSELAGLDVYQTVERLRVQYGRNAAILAIGPAGEMRLAAANIAATDLDGVPARHAGRGGVGAVMGAKRLKAIVIDPAGSRPPEPFDRRALSGAARRLAQELQAHPTTGKSLPVYGTAILVSAIDAIGGLPTRNFQTGTFEGAARISGEALHDLIVQRGGKPTHPCMPGCVIRCSNVLPDSEGGELTRALEYESIVLLGANCGISDLEAVAQLNRRCDELGLDTMEMGAAIGVAMEAGVISFGDSSASLGLVEEIAHGSPLGRALGSGAALTGRVFGLSHVPVVRGQAISAYDPRALKGTGVTYATSPMGADHTAGNALPGSALPDGTQPDPAKAKGQVALSRYLQKLALVFDTLGLCWFTRPPILADPSLLTDLLQAQHGGNWTMEQLLDEAGTALATELTFNREAGTGGGDSLPRFFRVEPLPPRNTTFDIPEVELCETLADLRSYDVLVHENEKKV